jgi:hypothetical protein
MIHCAGCSLAIEQARLGIPTFRPKSASYPSSYLQCNMQPVVLSLFTSTERKQSKRSAIFSTEQLDEQLTKALKQKTIEDPHYWSMPNRDRRHVAHALFQYPAMMVPEVQRRLISTICQINPKITSLYDPFVGSGTALVAGMLNGLECIGQDINPLAVLLSRVKTQPYRYKTLKSKVLLIVNAVKRDESNEIAVSFPGIDKWFRNDVQIGLSRLRRAILQQPIEFRPFFWVALAETIRLTSNDRTSTYKLHARATDEISARVLDVINTFKNLGLRGCQDLRTFHFNLAEAKLMVKRNTYKGQANIVLENTQKKAVKPSDLKLKFDLLVTSPPYGDNITTVPYGQHSYLALNWIQLSDIEPSIDTRLLATTQEIDRRSLGGSLERNQLSELTQQLATKSPTLAVIINCLLKKTVKDGATRIASFYRDLDECLSNILSVMNPKAYLCWTVANRRVGDVEIPIDTILTELLDAHHVQLITSIDRTIHHKRMPSRNKTADTMKQERILIFRTP